MTVQTRIAVNFNGLHFNAKQGTRCDVENAFYELEAWRFEKVAMIAEEFGYGKVEIESDNADLLDGFDIIANRVHWDAEAELNFIATLEAHRAAAPAMFERFIEVELAR